MSHPIDTMTTPKPTINARLLDLTPTVWNEKRVHERAIIKLLPSTYMPGGRKNARIDDEIRIFLVPYVYAYAMLPDSMDTDEKGLWLDTVAFKFACERFADLRAACAFRALDIESHRAFIGVSERIHLTSIWY